MSHTFKEKRKGMISIDNYFREIEKINVHNLPETLKKSHDFVTKTTSNGNNLNLYHNNLTIKKTIDLYLNKINEFVISTESKPSTEHIKPKRQATRKDNTHSSKITKSKTRDSQQRKNPARVQSAKDSKKVEHISEEIKYIKRFVSLHNKIKSPGAILSFIKALQKSIIQKLIRKTSPLSNEIEMIQDKLVNAFNKMKGEEKFEINEKDLSKLVSIAGGEEVYPSINLIKRFIGLQGKQAEEKKFELFIKQLENALANKKITNDDPYTNTVKSILKKLKNRTSATVSITKSELSGLEGIVKSCSCKSGLGKIYNTYGKKLRPCRKQTYSDARKGACSHNKGLEGIHDVDPNGLLTAKQLVSLKVEQLEFTDPWYSLMGKPAPNFTIMFHGGPGAGKTTLLLKLAEYLSNNFGNVLYVSSEEHGGSTQILLTNELFHTVPENLHFVPDLETADLADYDFIILDSVNVLGITLDDFKNLKKKYPSKSFLLVLQQTKNGDYRGGKDWEHEIQIGAKVEKGVATVYRNRFGIKGTLDFFKYFGIQPVQKLTPSTVPNEDHINNDLM